MSHLEGIQLEPASLERFATVLDEPTVRNALSVAQSLAERLKGRVLWSINSTAVGGGVAEMLQSLLRYARGSGIDARWLVIRGNPDFFHITKRLHHALHGSRGDGTTLGDEAHRIYRETLHENAVEIAACVRPRDVVLLHDPQTAGLAAPLRRAGAHVIWRCHIGCDRPNEEVTRGWDFLRPYLEPVDAFVFSRNAYVPEFCDDRADVVKPSIDAFSAKNRELDPDTIRTVLVHTGLVEGPLPNPPRYGFVRGDGSPGRVERAVDVIRLGRAPGWETPLVVQVSRWDPLKDPLGVMQGFAKLCDGAAPAEAELVLAGPNVNGVTDDPEGGEVFARVLSAWRELEHSVRARVHLASLPTEDVEENAVIVNALQRHATIVVQKSLQEGFGLTVTEAMWKARPVVASAVGGIQEQIEDGVSGVLLDDPTDLDAFASALCSLLDRPERSRELGAAARERVRAEFLGVRHLMQYADLIKGVDERRAPTP